MLPYKNKDSLSNSLRNVLIAYSNFDKDVGYVQGLNFIVGSILYNIHHRNFKNLRYSYGRDIKELNYIAKNINQINSDYEEFKDNGVIEALTFWIVIYIFYSMNWRELFMDNFPKMYILIDCLENNIREEFPEFYDLLLENDITIQEIFGNSILSILFYKIPLEYTDKIIDNFLYEGEKIVIEILLRMLKLNISKVMQLSTKESIFDYFSNYFFSNTFSHYKENIQVIFPYPLTENYN